MSRENSQNATILISDPNSPVPLSPPSSPRQSSQDKPAPPHSDEDPQTDSKQPAALPPEPDQALVNEIEWTAELDVALLYALQNHKLVGSNKYFHMIFVHDAFTRNAGIRCTIACLWDRVSHWYNLDLLADNELSPFPLTGPNDFSLPRHFSRTHPLDAPLPEGQPASHRLRSIHKTK